MSRVFPPCVLLGLLFVLAAGGCRGVSRGQMASMPLDRYAIEYYLLSER